MAELTEINFPSFFMFPYHTDRTAWRPFGLPMILVVPHMRDISGAPFGNAGVKSVRISIVDAGKSPVAGHDHVGIFNPSYEVFGTTLNQAALNNRIINLDSVEYLDSSGASTTTRNAEDIKFTCRAGIIGEVKYISHADYIDISDVQLEVEQLPNGRYFLSYEATYYERSISDNDELLCISDNETTASSRMLIKHPGEALQMMFEVTPNLYFTSDKKSTDTTIEFYRPFSDILQDIHDEQELQQRVNWVYDVSPENIPYLGFLLGWELPYFPQSVDALRRTVLRNIVKLQKLKGSKRAVRELFDLFGFAVDVENIWWTPDGEQYVAPGEELATGQEYEIGSSRMVTTEPLLLEFTEDGFAQTSVPIIHRVVGRSMTVRAYVAERGSSAHTYLSQVGVELSTDFDALDYSAPNTWLMLPSTVSQVEAEDGLIGSTTALIGTDGYVSDITTSGDAPIMQHGLKQDFVANVLDLSLSKYHDFTEDETVLYIFATYVYDKITIPSDMGDLQSNRFDIIIVEKDGEQVDPNVITFLVDFLFNIKAFHSLLRKVMITMLASDTYQVTDFCVGGKVQQSLASDAGKQQTPPEAIIPTSPGDCPHYTPEEYGFRRWDIDYRDRVLGDLAAEFNAWAALEANCTANEDGQDRTSIARTQQTELEDAIRTDDDATRATLCELDGSDYCYEGRPKDQISYRMDLSCDELWRFKPCELGMGAGVYYTYPSPGFLGNSILNGYIGINDSNPALMNLLGHKYRAYSRTDPNSLHYSNNISLDDSDVEFNWLAIRRISLDIQKDNLNFPGHRLPTLGALEADFVSPTWQLKPWDIPLDCDCHAPRYANPLNASLELDSTGEVLVFDYQPYELDANGLTPDISSLCEHEVGSGTNIVSEDEVTHAIYMDILGGHPAITLDGAVQSTGIIDVDSVRTFRSATDCGSGVVDVSDGYPASTGFLSDSEVVDVIDYFPSSSDSAALANGLDIPAVATDCRLLFTLISQIAVDPASFTYDLYRHNRLDCGCLHIICGADSATVVPLDLLNLELDELFDMSLDDLFALEISPPTVMACTAEEFLQEYGTTDNDQVEYDQTMILPELIDTPLEGVDDQNSSLFNLRQTLDDGSWVLDVNGAEGPAPWPDEGSFSFKDDYGVIYETYWETISSYLDIITIKKEPRVWGVSENAGRLVNREVYRTGIITTARQIFINIQDVWQLAAEVSEQKIGEFKSTYLCNPPFTDPFILHLNHNLQDLVGWAVTCGSHWTDPSEDSSENVVWTGISGPGGAAQPLIWIDIFGDHDLTAVCG